MATIPPDVAARVAQIAVDARADRRRRHAPEPPAVASPAFLAGWAAGQRMKPLSRVEAQRVYTLLFGPKPPA
jgi:hypothetical protein